MTNFGNPGISLLEVPDVFRQRDFFDDATLRSRVVDDLERKNGGTATPEEIEWALFETSMPFTSNAIVASAALTDSSKPYALDVTPVEPVRLKGLDFDLFVKQENSQKTGSVAVRGYLYAGLYQTKPNHSHFLTFGSRYQLEAAAYMAGHLGMKGLVYVPKDFEAPELDPDLLELLEIQPKGHELADVEALYARRIKRHAKTELPLHPITGFYINTGKRSVVGETVVQVPEADHIYFPQDSALSGQGVHIAREAYGEDVRVSSVRLAPMNSGGDFFSELVEARMARGALELATQISDHQAVRHEIVTPALAAQAMEDYAEATGDPISLSGGLAIAAVIQDSANLRGTVVAIVEGGNISNDEYERTLKGVASLA